MKLTLKQRLVNDAVEVGERKHANVDDNFGVEDVSNDVIMILIFHLNAVTIHFFSSGISIVISISNIK